MNEELVAALTKEREDLIKEIEAYEPIISKHIIATEKLNLIIKLLEKYN